MQPIFLAIEGDVLVNVQQLDVIEVHARKKTAIGYIGGKMAVPDSSVLYEFLTGPGKGLILAKSKDARK